MVTQACHQTLVEQTERRMSKMKTDIVILTKRWGGRMFGWILFTIPKDISGMVVGWVSECNTMNDWYSLHHKQRKKNWIKEGNSLNILLKIYFWSWYLRTSYYSITYIYATTCVICAALRDQKGNWTNGLRIYYNKDGRDSSCIARRRVFCNSHSHIIRYKLLWTPLFNTFIFYSYNASVCGQYFIKWK